MRARIIVILVGAVVAVCALGLVAVVLVARNTAAHASDVIGHWRSADGRAGLTVEANGTFTSHDFPLLEVFPDLDPQPRGTGTWALAPVATYKPYSTLELRFDGGATGDVGFPLNIDLRHGTSTLFFWRGDPDSDNRYVFVRQT